MTSTCRPQEGDGDSRPGSRLPTVAVCADFKSSLSQYGECPGWNVKSSDDCEGNSVRTLVLNMDRVSLHSWVTLSSFLSHACALASGAPRCNLQPSLVLVEPRGDGSIGLPPLCAVTFSAVGFVVASESMVSA